MALREFNISGFNQERIMGQFLQLCLRGTVVG